MEKSDPLILYYVTDARIPTEKANGIQIMSMCDAFSEAGVKVDLILPNRKNPDFAGVSPEKHYPLKNRISIRRLPTVDLFAWDALLGDIPFHINRLCFSLSLFFFFVGKKREPVYTREYFIALLLSLLGYEVCFEAHNFPDRPKAFFLRNLARFDRIVAITEGLKKKFVKEGYPEERISVHPDAVNIELFQGKESVAACRDKLALPRDKKIVLYSGHLYPWKGAHTLVEAAAQFGQEVLFLFVGGLDEDIERLKKAAKSDNLIFAGLKTQKEIPSYLKAADLLVLPNSGKENISKSYTSPLKLFEYLIVGGAIVASDLPSIREILEDEKNALLFEPDSWEDLAEKIKVLLRDDSLRGRLKEAARRKGGNYSWFNRANKIKSEIFGASDRKKG